MAEKRPSGYRQLVDELQSVVAKKVVEVVAVPNQRKVIACQWVFALKRNSKGENIRHKVRLERKGFTHVYEVDITEVFSAVVRFETLRIMLSYIAVADLELQQAGAKRAFSYVELFEKLHMQLPDKSECVGNVLRQNLVDIEALL